MVGLILTAILAAPAVKPDPWVLYTELQRRQSDYAVQTNMDLRWNEDSKGFYYRLGGSWTFHDVASGEERGAEQSELPERPSQTRPGGFAPRGQSVRIAESPDGQQMLRSDGFNLVLEHKGNSATTKITEDGGPDSRLQYGAVSWVYGEEWGQRQAIGWSPDGKRFWYYKFDNNPVKPFYLLSNNDKFVNGVDALDYPKAGDPNPKVEIWVADYPGLTKRLAAATDEDKAAYLFDVSWSPDSSKLIFQRADRRHQVRQIVTWDALSTKEKVVLTESNPDGWIHGMWFPPRPTSGSTAIITTEQSGFFNFARLNYATGGLERITRHPFEVDQLVHTNGDQIFYTAYTGDSAQYKQLFVKFGQSESYQITDSHLTHRSWISPNGEYVVNVSENPSTPRSASLLSIRPQGAKTVRTIAREGLSKAAEGVRSVETRTFKSADGKYDLLATISRPEGGPKDGPVILDVYNGPESVGVSPSFQQPHPWTAFGFTIVKVETRGGDNRGRAFRNEDYRKLGITEIDDIAAAIKAICAPNQKVGIQGTSYGGYVAALSILRYPDLIHASVACSSVTDYRHYDTIYTERFMGLPSENKDGYDAGSCMTYAKDLKGKLLLYFGMRDDNVHPNNSLQLIQALRTAGKDFSTVIGPNAGHTYVGTEIALKFFGEHLGNPIPPREGTL